MGGDGFQIFRILFPGRVLGAEEIGRRGLGVDCVEICEAEGVRVEGWGDEFHLSGPGAEGCADFPGIDDEEVDDSGTFQGRGDAETGWAGPDDEHAGDGVYHSLASLSAWRNQEMT